MRWMANVLQVGPRQGVHISQRQQQQVGGGRWCSDLAVLPAPIIWRPFQFRSPEKGYMYRARIDAPTTVPTLQTMRGQPQNHENSSVRMPRLGASSKIHSTTSRHQKPEGSGKHGTELTLTAHAITMQPRPPQRPVLPRSTESITKQPFSYLDPTKVKNGNLSFDVRIAELAKLERDTIRYEECKNQPSNKRTLRPSSAINLRSASPICKVAPQTVQQVSRSIVTYATAPKHLGRKTSLPSTLKPSSYSRPVSAGSCSSTSEQGTPVSPEAANRLSKTSSELHSQVPPVNGYPASTESPVVIVKGTARDDSVEPELAVTLPDGARAGMIGSCCSDDGEIPEIKEDYNEDKGHRRDECGQECRGSDATQQSNLENGVLNLEAVTASPRGPDSQEVEVEDLEVTSVVCVELNKEESTPLKSKKVVHKKQSSRMKGRAFSTLEYVSSDTSMTSTGSQCSLRSTKSTRSRISQNKKGKADSKTVKASAK